MVKNILYVFPPPSLAVRSILPLFFFPPHTDLTHLPPIKHHQVDVGFGSSNPIHPLLLTDGTTGRGAPGIEAQLLRRSIPDHTQPDQRCWVLETRDATSNRWSDQYCFTEVEWLPQDFDIINYRTSHDPESWFVYALTVTRLLLDDNDGGEGRGQEAIGTVTLTGDTVKRRLGPNESETLQVCRSETERVEMLQKWFGIKLNESEIRGIRGISTEIKV